MPHPTDEPDERTRLVNVDVNVNVAGIASSIGGSTNGYGSNPSCGAAISPFKSSQHQHQHQPSFISNVARTLNPLSQRWHLIELCDLWVVPPFVRQCCQDMLAAQWTHRLPMLQKCSPARLAAMRIQDALDQLDLVDGEGGHMGLRVVDFCSGGGGPVPEIEHIVNAHRHSSGKAPISFELSDIKPHINAWMKSAAHSAHLTFVPQAVDATNPPVSVTSASTLNGFSSDSLIGPDSRIFRLYCLAFHHFDDEMAAKVLKSSMDTSDGFAILELQERNIASLLLMVLDFFFAYLATLFWFFDSPLQILLTYVIPILPFILSFDGLVSCLRTRTFEEVVKLVRKTEGKGDAPSIQVVEDSEGRIQKRVEMGNWELVGGRQCHTWPLGYFNYIVAKKVVH